MGNSIPISAHSNKRHIGPSDAKCTFYIPSPRGKTSETPKIRIREIILSKNNIAKALHYQDRLSRFQTFGSSKMSTHPSELHNIKSSPTKSNNSRPDSINYIVPTAMPSQKSNNVQKKNADSIYNKENMEGLPMHQALQPSHSSAASREGLPPLSSAGKHSIQNTPDWRSNSKSSEPNSLTTLTKNEPLDSSHTPVIRSTTPSKNAVSSTPVPIANVPNFIKHVIDTRGVKDNALRESNLQTNHAQMFTEPNVVRNFNFNTPSKTESAERLDSTDRSKSKEIPARKHRLLLSSSAKKLKNPESVGPQDSTLFNNTTQKENSTTALLLQNGYNNPFNDGTTKTNDMSQTIKQELSKFRETPIPMITTTLNPTPATINNYLGGLNSGNVTSSSLQSKLSPQDSKVPKLPGFTLPIKRTDEFKLTEYIHSGDKNRPSQQPMIDIALPTHMYNDSRGSSISGIPHNSSRPYTVDNSLQIDTNLLRDTSSSPINHIVSSILYKNNSPGYPPHLIHAMRDLTSSSHRSRHDTFGLESDLLRSSKLQTFRDGLDSAKNINFGDELSNRNYSPLTDSNLRASSSRVDFGEMPNTVKKVLLKDYLSPKNVSFPEPPKLSPVSKLDNKYVVSPLLNKSPLRDDRVTPMKAAQTPSPKPTPNVVSPKKTGTPTSSPQKYSHPTYSPMTNINSYAKKFSPKSSPQNKDVSPKNKSVSPQNRVSPQHKTASPKNKQISPQNKQVSPQSQKEKSPTNNSKKTPPKEKFPVFKISTPEEKSPQKSVGSPSERFHIVKVNSPQNRIPTSPDQSNQQYSVRSPTNIQYSTNRDGVSPVKSNAERKSPVNKKSTSPGRTYPQLDTKSPKSPTIEKYAIKDKYTRLKSPSADKASKTTSIPEKSVKSPKDEKSVSINKSRNDKPPSFQKENYDSVKSHKEIPVIDDKPHSVEEYFLIEASPIIEQFPAIVEKYDQISPVMEKSVEKISSKKSTPKAEISSVKFPSPKQDKEEKGPTTGLVISPQRETKSLSPLKSSPGPTKIQSPIKQKFPSPKKDEQKEKLISQNTTSISSNEEASPFLKYLKDSSRDLTSRRFHAKKSTAKFPVKALDYPDSNRKTPEPDLFAGITGLNTSDKKNPQTVTAYEIALAKVFPSKSPKPERKYPPLSAKNVVNRSLQDPKAYNSDRSHEVSLSEAKAAHQDFINHSQRGSAQPSSRDHPNTESLLMNQIQSSSQVQQDPMIAAQLQALAQVKEEMLISLTETKLQKIQDVFLQKIDTIHKDLLTRIESLQNTNNSTNTHSNPSNGNTQKSSTPSINVESERVPAKSPVKSTVAERTEKSKSPSKAPGENAKNLKNVPESNTESESYYPKPSSEEKVRDTSSAEDEMKPKSKISAKVKKLIKGAGNGAKSQKKLSTLLTDDSDKKNNFHRFSFGGVHDTSTNKRESSSSPSKPPLTNTNIKQALSKSPTPSPPKKKEKKLGPNAAALTEYQKLLGDSPIKKNSPPKVKKQTQSPGSQPSSEHSSPQKQITESPLNPKIDLYSKIKNPSVKKLRKPSPAGYETSPNKSKPVTPAKVTKSSSKKESSSPDTVYSRLKAKGTPQRNSSKSKKTITTSNSRAISPSDIKASPLQSASKLLGLNPNLEGSHFMTHVELFPSTERFGHSNRDKERSHPSVPQLRGLASLNPLESHVVINENEFHSPPQPNYPTLEKELEEAFEAAAGRKSATSKSEKIVPKINLKSHLAPTLQTSSNLMTLSPEKTSERRPQPALNERHYIQTEINHPKPIKASAADTEVTNKSGTSLKNKDKSINYEKEEEHYLRRVLNKQPAISPIIGSKNSDPKHSGSNFSYQMKPKYPVEEEINENVPPKDLPMELKNMKRIGSRQNSVSKNDPSALFYLEKKDSVPHYTEIPSGQSAEYSSANIENSSSVPPVGETAFEREKRLRDEIKYLKTKLKDLTVKGVGVSPNKLLKVKSKKMKAKTNKIAAKTFDNDKERKSEDPTHKRQRSNSKSVPKSRELTPNNLGKKMSASMVETLDIECRRLSNTPIRLEMGRNSSANVIKRKSSIEDINRKLAKTSTTSKIKQNAINKAQEKFFEEYSNKINENDLRKASNKNLEIEDVMRVGRGMIRSSSVKPSQK